MDNLKVYDGGSSHSDLIKNMTGTYSRNTKVSSPRNQMFIEFNTTSIVDKIGFKTSILENSTCYQTVFAH